MNNKTQELLDKINELTKDNRIIYFAKDAERALGLENYLDNYYIVCIDESYITQEISKTYPSRIFCAQSEGIELKTNSTLNLINHPKTIEWLKKVTNGKFYAQLFQFNNPTYLNLQNLGGTILNNSATLNRMFEDKLSQTKILHENGILTPKTEVKEVIDDEYNSISKDYGEKFVIQLDRAHTGIGTFIITNEDEFNNFKNNYSGNIVKLSEFIEGEPYTINGCVTKNGIFICGLQYQITGYEELTAGKGSTVGNDWSLANSLAEEIKSKIFNETEKIGNIMKEKGFKGLFGIDLIIKDNEIFIIEINARQTANISMQTKLEIQQDQIPLELLHLAEFLGVEVSFSPEERINQLEGSQIFLRAKQDKFQIKTHLDSGIYRLQSDNSAFDWSSGSPERKEKVIFIDEEKDKPLVWQKDGYSVDQITDGGFVLLVQNQNSIKDKYEEVARMQFQNQIVYNNKVTPWVIEAMKVLENLLK